MSTTPYPQSSPATTARDTLPMVVFARSIKKNTAEFTSSDLRKFIRWLWRVQPYKNNLCIAPQKTYYP